MDDLWSLDLTTWKWTQLAVEDRARPSARYSHGFTSVGNMLYVYGGRYFTDAGLEPIVIALSLSGKVSCHVEVVQFSSKYISFWCLDDLRTIASASWQKRLVMVVA